MLARLRAACRRPGLAELRAGDDITASERVAARPGRQVAGWHTSTGVRTCSERTRSPIDTDALVPMSRHLWLEVQPGSRLRIADAASLEAADVLAGVARLSRLVLAWRRPHGARGGRRRTRAPAATFRVRRTRCCAGVQRLDGGGDAAGRPGAVGRRHARWCRRGGCAASRRAGSVGARAGHRHQAIHACRAWPRRAIRSRPLRGRRACGRAGWHCAATGGATTMGRCSA